MGYQPKPEDLDYPARLERLAASTPEAPPAAAANLVDAENDDVNVRLLFKNLSTNTLMMNTCGYSLLCRGFDVSVTMCWPRPKPQC